MPPRVPPPDAWSPLDALRRGAAAALCLAGARAVLVLLRYGSEDLGGAELRVALPYFLRGVALVLPAATLVALAAGLVARRGAVGLGRAAAALVALAAGFGFASFRLPELALYVPALETARGLSANAGALLAALLAAWLVAPGSPFPLRRGALAVAAAALVGGGGALLLLRGEPAAWPQRPNLILVSLDTLRPDHLGAYGYERPTSPSLDRFAASSVRFTRAYTHEAWTLTAHMTMLTSLQPSAHGVEQERTLSPRATTLAEALDAVGYDTFAVVDDCGWLHPQYGFARGFDVYRVLGAGAEAKVDQVLELVDGAGDRPFLLFAHFYDVHSDFERLPYDSAPEDRAAFAGWYEGEFSGCAGDAPCASRYLQELNQAGERLAEEDVRYLRSLYDAGIRTLDRALGRLFDALEADGHLARSAVIVTSDHGEEFYEHGRALHTQEFDETARIPFLLRTPETGGAVSDRLVVLADVMPTLLDLAGVDLGAPGLQHLQGRSLADYGRGGEPAWTRERVSADRKGRVHAVRTSGWTWVRRFDRWYLFDARQDPLQARDLADDARLAEVRAELEAAVEAEEARLTALRESFGVGRGARELSSEEREQLEDLGYLGE